MAIPRTTQTPWRRPRGTRANATIEMVLALGILLNLTFGTIEFGHFFFVKNTLQGAAREGARAAITAGATNADVNASVNGALTAAGFNTASYTVQIRNNTDTADIDVSAQPSGAGILVRVSGSWGTVGLRPLGLISAAKAVAGAAVMRKEPDGGTASGGGGGGSGGSGGSGGGDDDDDD